MAFVPSASWNSRSITHLANYPSPSLPMISSDEPEKPASSHGSDDLRASGQHELQALMPRRVRSGAGLIAQYMVLIAARAITSNDRPVNANTGNNQMKLVGVTQAV